MNRRELMVGSVAVAAAATIPAVAAPGVLALKHVTVTVDWNPLPISLDQLVEVLSDSYQDVYPDRDVSSGTRDRELIDAIARSTYDGVLALHKIRIGGLDAL